MSVISGQVCRHIEAARRYYVQQQQAIYLGDHLGVGRGISTGGFKTWVGCCKYYEVLELMIKYAKQDVDLLRKVYMQLRSLMKNHLNLNGDDGGHNCPTCGSSKLQKRGVRYTQVATYQQWQCTDCGSYSRTRVSEQVERPSIVP